MDFVKLSEQRFTAKKFDVNKKIPRDDVEKLKTILQLSPSSVNSQPWVFLWGTSDNSKKRVRPAIADFNWNRIDTCSDFIVIAVRKGLDDKFQHTLLDQEIKDGRIANEEIAKECFESRKFFIDLRERTGQTLNWETKQAYIAMTALLYGAASLGIDSTPIEGFDEDKMDKLLNLDNYGVHSGCAVLDVRMPQMTGLEVQETLIERGFAHFPLIFLSGHGDIQMAVNAMSKGALTFLEKPVDPERLNQEVTRAVKLGIRRAEEANELNALKRRYRQLTNREKEVLSLVAEGLTNKEIADRLELSVPTIKMHRSRASEKLAMDSVAEITRALILLNEASAK